MFIHSGLIVDADAIDSASRVTMGFARRRVAVHRVGNRTPAGAPRLTFHLAASSCHDSTRRRARWQEAKHAQ